MKPIEIRDLENEDLLLRIRELKEELFNMRFHQATGQLDNHARISVLKRDIARMRTVMREREFEAWAEEERRLAAEAGASASTEEGES